MHILLDENLDRRLKHEFGRDCDVETVAERGWKGRTNGDLLELSAGIFDAFVTADHNIPSQLKLADYQLAIFVLIAPTNRISDHQPLIPLLIDALNSARPGTVTNIVRTDDDK